MARFLQKYVTPYFEKVMIAGNKTVRDFPNFRGNLKDKRYMCMHHILEKCMNPNCTSYHAQEKINGCILCVKCMHSNSNRYGIHLGEWGSRHSGSVSIRRQEQEGRTNLNVCCPILPNVFHTWCYYCAYIFHIICIHLFFLCMVGSAICVHTFFQDVVHAHVSFIF